MLSMDKVVKGLVALQMKPLASSHVFSCASPCVA